MNLEDIKKIKAGLAQAKPDITAKKGRSLELLILDANAADEKRAKKIPKTAEEKADLEYLKILEAFNKRSEELIHEQQEVKPWKVHDPKKLWDVTKDEVIEYFDPTLSYELTGYRPITETEGLDFDPTLFTKAADYYKQYGRYTDLIPGTFRFKLHWDQEFDRCQNGCTIGKYRLTGENYFFLNYFRLPSVLDKSGSELQEENFPAFLAKQYEYFHYMEMCRASGHDGILFKSRGVGASLIAASNAVCAYMFHKASRNIVTAYQDSYVDDTLSKCWQELDFLNTCTLGAFKRVRMKTDTNRKKKASKVDLDKNESGWGSIIEGITSDEPRKLRGARVLNLYIEESGSHPNLISTYIQSRALVIINGYRVGYRWAFGTAGDKTPNLAGLKDMFYNPEEYLALPYRHNYTQSGEYVYTGYFIPSYTMWFGTPENPGFDSRGVVDEKRAKEYYESVWKKMKDPLKLLLDKAEYCFTPEDAFILEGSNRFDQELLVDQLHALTIHKTVELPKPARLVWSRNSNGEVDRDSRPQIEVIDRSSLEICEMPIVDELGIPYSNLYYVGCLTPGEKVMTESGLKNCEDVTLEDKLYSIQGKPVDIINLQRYWKEDENIYKVKLNNIFRTTTFTGEHPIYCATPKKRYHGAAYAKRNNLPYAYYTYDFDFKLMKDVQVGDFVKVPNIYQKEKAIPHEYWPTNVRCDFRIESPLENPDFWWIVGFILGDGWCQKSKNDSVIGYVINANESEYEKKLLRIIPQVLNRAPILTKNHLAVKTYQFSCKLFWDFFSSVFGRGAKNKHVPEWVKFLPRALKLLLIMGYLASDGCVCPKQNSMNFVSCSYELLEGIQDILFSLGIISSVHYLRSEEKVHYITNHKKPSVVSKAWTLDVHGQMLNKFKSLYNESDLKLDKWQIKDFSNHAIPRCFFEDDSCKYIYIKISEIEISKYTGIVYNYHCDTSTFMCKYIPTHNCDSIDSDSTTSTGQTDVSDFCAVVFRKQFGLKPPKVVAIYKERPKHILTAFDNALKLCLFYNAKMLFEATRVSIKNYFQLHNKLHWLMTRPRSTSNTSTRTNLKLYGCPVNPNIIDHYLDLIELYIVDHSTEILFPQMIDELMRYSYENKRKFDIVAGLGMALIADEETIGRVAKPSQPYKPNWGFSYVKNQYGQIELITGDDKEREIRTGGSRDNSMSLQTPFYKSSGSSFWRG